MFFSAAAGILYDRAGPKWPFILVGISDASFAVFCILMALCGVIRNDIKERKELEVN